MAVDYEASYILIEDADGTISQSVTIPANATFLLIAFMGYRSAGLTFTSISLAGTAITNVAHSFNSGGNYQNVVVYRMASPATGSQTFAATWSGADEGGHVIIIPCSGVATSSPVRDSDATGVDGASWADGIGTLSLDSQSGDLAVSFVNTYANVIDVNRSGQTVIVATSTAYNNDQAAAAYEAATGASISAEAYTSSGYATMVTIVLAQASGGGEPENTDRTPTIGAATLAGVASLMNFGNIGTAGAATLTGIASRMDLGITVPTSL